MTELEELVDSEVERLKSRKDVSAVAVVGSYARDPSQDHNDIDIYVIIDGDWRKRVTEEIEGIVFEKFFNSMEWAKSYFDREGESWYMHHWMRNADVRHDPEGIFEELEEYSEQKLDEKMNLSDQEREKILYNIWDYQQDLDTEDVGQKRYMMYQMFEYLIHKHYLLKGEVPVKDNYRIKKLQEFDGYMYKLAQEFLTSSSTMEKEKKLEKMVSHVTRDLGKVDPEWETEKEEFEY